MSILEYIPGRTLLHRASPLAKLLLAFAMTAAIFITRSHFVVLGLLGLTLGIAAFCHCGRWALRVVRSLLGLSVVLFVLQTAFTRSGAVLFMLPLGIAVTSGGVAFSALFVLRLITCALPLALMLRVTKGIDLAKSLHKNLRVPFRFAFTISSAMRFVPGLFEEMGEIIEAQTARGVELDSRNPFKKLRLLAPLCLPLLLSGVKKAQTAAISAELRGLSLRGRDA
ncbi:MAG: energy-coupling factor transporter transmembrane protein EcfT [Oscillospiraceae bacterium]|jgi:energy-coupling factor transport system permease protein|nr:energy-coupling factor transporter transmembrane protein EcfT [Oscillospiraceae bacterium]